MKRRFLRHALVGSFLITTALLAVESKAACDKFFYVNGAGLKMRSKPAAATKALAVLKFNASVCVFGIEKDWSQISFIESEDTKGWIQTKFLSAQQSERKFLIQNLESSISKKDFASAINWAERALEDTAHPPRPKEQIKLLETILSLYKLTGQTQKENQITNWIAEAREKAKPPALGNAAGFQTWFYDKFNNSSAYLITHNDIEISQDEAILIIKTFGLEGKVDLKTVDGDSDNHGPNEYMAIVLGKFIYPAIYGKAPSLSVPPEVKALLEDPEFAVRVASRYSEILEYLPAGTLNDARFIDRRLKHCGRGYGNFSADSISKLTADTVRPRIAKIMNCTEALTEFTTTFPFSIEPKVLATYIEELDLTRAAELFKVIPQSTRESEPVLRHFITKRANIYGSLTPALQQRQDIKEYALTTTMCQDSFPANKKDKAFVLSFLAKSKARFNGQCFPMLDASLREDLSIAISTLEIDPRAIVYFSPDMQTDERVISKLVGESSEGATARGTHCPFNGFPPNFSMELKGRIVSARPACITSLKESDFENQSVMTGVTANQINLFDFERLPAKVKLHPKILFGTEHETSKESIFVDLKRGLDEKAVLAIANEYGINALTRLTIRYNEEAQGDSDERPKRISWEPGVDPPFSAEFWNSLARMAVAKKTDCLIWLGLPQFQPVFFDTSKKKSNAKIVAAVRKISGCKIENPL